MTGPHCPSAASCQPTPAGVTILGGADFAGCEQPHPILVIQAR